MNIADVAANITPMGLINSIASIAKPLLDLIPNPADKMRAQQIVLDHQYGLQQSLIAQQDKEMDDATANIKGDTSMMRCRSFFCYSVTVLYIWNYALCRFAHQMPIDLPTSLHAMFATIMLGFVGIPAGIDMAKSIAAMPGDSSVSMLGFKASNSGGGK